MNVYHDIRHLEYKHIKTVHCRQATCIPQVKAHFNQVLNTFYNLYTDKAGTTQTSLFAITHWQWYAILQACYNDISWQHYFQLNNGMGYRLDFYNAWSHFILRRAFLPTAVCTIHLIIIDFVLLCVPVLFADNTICWFAIAQMTSRWLVILPHFCSDLDSLPRNFILLFVCNTV